MDFLTILLVAVALAMDAFAVSVSCGMIVGRPGPGHYFRLAFHFGLFQFLMPLVGFLAGKFIGKHLASYDHWIAFLLLVFIGVKMIRESLSRGDEGITECSDPTKGWSLVMLSLATSIDALAVGFSLGILDKPVLWPSIVIGIVCAFFTLAGVYLGKKVSSRFSSRAEIAGGLVLIGIGIKILLEHLFAGI